MGSIARGQTASATTGQFLPPSRPPLSPHFSLLLRATVRHAPARGSDVPPAASPPESTFCISMRSFLHGIAVVLGPQSDGAREQPSVDLSSFCADRPSPPYFESQGRRGDRAHYAAHTAASHHRKHLLRIVFHVRRGEMNACWCPVACAGTHKSFLTLAHAHISYHGRRRRCARAPPLWRILATSPPFR